MIDLQNLGSLDYWFATNPGGEFILGYGLLVFFLVLFFVPSLLKAQGKGNKHLKKSMKKRLGVFLALSIIGLILVAARFSEVPVFSMRIWLYLVLALSLFFLVRNGRLIHKDYKRRQKSVERETGR